MIPSAATVIIISYHEAAANSLPAPAPARPPPFSQIKIMKAAQNGGEQKGKSQLRRSGVASTPRFYLRRSRAGQYVVMPEIFYCWEAMKLARQSS